jgi:2-iminoacetate synthase
MNNLAKYDSFSDILDSFNDFDFEEYFQKVSDEDIKSSLQKSSLDIFDFLNLLSKKAQNYLEEMAKIAYNHKIRHFGRVIQLYIPIYVSNYCNSNCKYCGFSKKNRIKRKHLTLDEIEKEAKEIAKGGIKHILLLTGEAKNIANLDYLIDAISVLKKYFDSIAIEVYPMEEAEYKKLVEAGADTLTIYQEVYDKDIYKDVHTSGQKKDYFYRLNTPLRGAKAGFRAVNIGTLFGLGEVKKEAFFSGLHAKYLMDKFINVEFSLSLPRINKADGNFEPKYKLDDISFVQFMLAYRLFMPMIGINISTREKASFRDNLLDLGVTKFSAGSKTDVGGYSDIDSSTPQFDISDTREIEEIVDVIEAKGYQPIFKDWEII